MEKENNLYRYFYAKLGKGNSLAGDFLAGLTPISLPAIPIFFDLAADNRDDFLNEGSAREQSRNFFWCQDFPRQSMIIAIHEGELFIAVPTGSVIFWRCESDLGYASEGDFVKFLPVEIVTTKRLSEVLSILASMTANPYYYMGTFREITPPGNIRAIQSIVNDQLVAVETAQDLLLCLGSIE